MKNMTKLLTLTMMTFLLMAFAMPVESGKVNIEKSIITWKGSKTVGGSHDGTVMLKSGTLKFEYGILQGGSFVMDMATIKNTDIPGKMAERLVGHLNSPDFFDVKKFPTAKFEMTKVTPSDDKGAYKIVGDLTIKGTTKEIQFDATVSKEGGNQIATADISIDRTEFGIRYGSDRFFDNLGDRVINDEFELNIKLVVE